jgi:signal transduction histidine kinase
LADSGLDVGFGQVGPAASADATTTLADFIRLRREQILEAWELRARQLAMGLGLSRPALIDHVPALLDQIVHYADELAAGSAAPPPRQGAEQHAHQRLAVGFHLGQVISEYAVLRDCILSQWQQAEEGGASLAVAGVRGLNRAIDEAIAIAVERFSAARERTLVGLDHITAASLESLSLDDLLERLLHVFLESAEAVDTVAILLREGDRLRVRATLGLDRVPRGLTLRMGEGYAGAIAAAAAPLAIADAATDPLAVHGAAYFTGLRGLYGVPLLEQGEVLGVAHMGSRTVGEFPPQDRSLFNLLANRATAFISQHLLRESLQQAVRVRDDLLAVVSHDLRNPLMTIKLTTTGLLVGQDDEDLRKALERIARSAGRMDRLIADLLDLASIQAGRPAMNTEAVEVGELLAETLEAHEPLAAVKQLQLRLEPPSWPVRLLADRKRLQQVLANLLGNAIKFSPPGAAVVLTAVPLEGELVVTVRDSGPGIDASELQNVFRAYWSSPRAPARGTGLGLFIAKGIVEAHGGRIWVESTPGQGSAFSFSLPLKDS